MPELTFYMDETGNRVPDKNVGAMKHDPFAFGGYIIAGADKEEARARWQEVVDKWAIKHPFHISDMLGERKKWSWLGNMTEAQRTEFWADYRSFLSSLPVVGQACVIDRPGYVARGYLEQHGANRWLLCRTAFDIAVERAAKYARHLGQRMRIVYETSPYNVMVEGYFNDLKANGLGFSEETSEKYQPLTQKDFAETLTTIEHKGKESPLLQIADSFIYAIARGKYDRHLPLWRELRDHQRVVNFALGGDAQLIKAMGVKYSCFDAKK